MDRGRSPNSAGPTAAGGANNSNNNSNSSKRNKPCQQCQKLKVKCERNPNGGPCTRCAAQNKECLYYEMPSKKRKKDPDESVPTTVPCSSLSTASLFRASILLLRESFFSAGSANCRRLDELEKTLESMRKSLEHGTPPTTTKVDNTFAAGNSFGHPLDMLARTAANTHSHTHSVSPELDRFPPSNAYSGITPPAQTTQRSTLRIATAEAIPTTWTADLSGMDPVERGWMDLDDAKAFFGRYVSPERSVYLLREKGY
jgi:Fungal Zn(2)-Cys(6) binuclear cluster domain